jgi:heavy metal sensor kinase
MRSIRLSLVVYFLVLVALALAATSALGYWTTAQIVEKRQDETRKLFCTQYERRCYREKGKFDNLLLTHARSLASLSQFQFQSPPARHFRLPALAPLGLLSAPLNPSGQWLVPLWAYEGTKSTALAVRIGRFTDKEIQFDEARLPPDPDSPGTEYFQINSEWGNVWRSRSMEDITPFAVDPSVFDSKTMKFLDYKFDEVEIRPGIQVRRVTLKAPASQFRYVSSGRAEAPHEFLALVVHCARDTAKRDATLAGFGQEHDQQLAELDSESRDTLATLRNRLLGMGLAAFILVAAGAFMLVRLGLAPLRRLSFAVSQVSPRDFKLQFDEGHLPSELRPIVEKLEGTLEQLRRAFAREKQAAADISHELRTPLAALLTTTEVALRKPRASEEYRELLADCHTIGQQMSQLVERLLALARLDAGVDILRPREVDAAALADQCAALVRPLAEARDLNLAVHHQGTANVTTDPDKLREVLTNLLHNAIEYNRPRGTVDVRVERHNGTLAIDVRDTGIGITPEAQAHIFERFYRADPARQATGLHAGLGLSIVKGYMDLMGGSISVESREGEGSTFHVRVPAA